MIDTGEGSRSASGEAGTSAIDGGPTTKAASTARPLVAGSSASAAQGAPDGDGARPLDGNVGGDQPKKKRRRRRRRRKKGAQQSPAEGRDAQQPLPKVPGEPLAPASQSWMTGAAPKVSETAIYAAIDLGTNNCRLLVAKRSRNGFRVIDAYSRIVRLGEGVAHSGELSSGAMDRALEALKVCSAKMQRQGVTRVRSIATEACRTAHNGPIFVERVKRETGITLDIVSTADEAQLAVAGCAPLLDPGHAAALVFDIGGGSTELMWVIQGDADGANPKAPTMIKDWTSLPCGVVTLAEAYGGGDVSTDLFEEMVEDVSSRLAAFRERLTERMRRENKFHLLGTSGTVTTIAGIHMELERYDRARVDGAWIGTQEVAAVTDRLLKMSLTERAAHPCVGVERADLVLAGCAILEAISRAWPTDQLRVADRGLREGILFSLMEEDEGRRVKRGRRRRRRKRSKSGKPEQKQASDSGVTT